MTNHRSNCTPNEYDTYMNFPLRFKKPVRALLTAIVMSRDENSTRSPIKKKKNCESK